MKNKQSLVKELEEYHQSLNVPMIHDSPNHKTSKDWLAEVAAILKNLDEGDYQEFMRLRKSIYPGVDRRTRINAANEIGGFIRQKVAEYKRYDFNVSKSATKRREIIIPIPSVKIPIWIINNIAQIIVGLIVTVIGGLLLYYFFGIK